MKKEYRNKLRLRLASTAIGPSTIRRLAPAGTIGPARSFLERIDLHQLASCSEVEFATLLDSLTLAYTQEVSSLPWGAARKFLNIFLRDCLYYRFICDEYNLTRIEKYLEVPLDNDVIVELKAQAGQRSLPKWRGVSKLTPDISKCFQQYAKIVAERNEVMRVDLDIEYWRGAKAQERKLKAAAKRPPTRTISALSEAYD